MVVFTFFQTFFHVCFIVYLTHLQTIRSQSEFIVKIVILRTSF